MAKWILGWTAHGEEVLINMDNGAIISRGKNDTSVVEWQDGNLQVTLTKPTFDELQKRLEDK